ncbi:hypothetical protein TNCV_419011 [Trichonephila clavipes]|uniref:Uncharacterized protein n=1 Tax=Trichonephila clavipes TaxID=2585209 RepID=A0A8X6S4W2_TRICX|nr:hypothetical protein TNCV_419011 [Trichonephila clavipes]
MSTQDRSEAAENSTGKLNNIIRKDPNFWVFRADLEKPGVNFRAAEDMLGRQLYIRVHCWTIAKDGSQIAM